MISCMKKDVHPICDRFLACRVAKSKVSPYGLYTSLHIPTTPLVDLAMDFVLGLLRSKVSLSQFLSWSSLEIFVSKGCITNVGNPFFREVVRLYGLLKTIVSNRDFKFLSHSEYDFVLTFEMFYREEFNGIGGMIVLYRVANATTSHSPFKLVYGFNPLSPLDLLHLRDLVWVHLRKDRLPNLRKSKLFPRRDGPFKILKIINDNTYVVDKFSSRRGA
ncbi:hypothetical protein CR513_52934, partial [Mucuna pruriens]